MAITINWPTKVINIPKADIPLVQTNPTEIRSLDLNWFRLQLKDIEDSEGIPFQDTHQHNTEVTVGGVGLARVIEIINGYTITFEDGQYAVNLFGANSNVGDVVNVNQVSVRSSNSAGLVSSQAIEFGEYGGGVTIDIANGSPGVIYPKGTLRDPVNNLTDAITIINSRGFDKVFIRGSLTLSSGDFSQGVKFYGQSPAVTMLTLEDLSDVNNCEFLDCYIQGTADDNNIVRECIIGDMTSFDGFFDRCAFNGNISLGGSTQSTFVDCFSNIAGSGTPTITVGTGSALAIRGYKGGLELLSKTGTDGCSIDLDSGQIKVASSCTTGEIIVRGIGKISNFSGGSVVNTNDLISGDRLNDIHIGIEELHPHTAGFGDVYYVDPDNGNDTTGVGHDRFRPWQSLNYAIGQATANNGDVIYIVSSAGLSKSYVREFVNVNKAGLSIRGANKEVHIHPTTAGTDSMTVTADYTSLINLTIVTHMGGTDNALTATNAHYLHLDNCTIKNATQDNIDISGCDQFELVNSFVGYSGRYNVKIHDAQDALIEKCHIDTSGSDNINITATASGTTHEVIVHDTIIHEAGGWGVNIGAGCETIQLHADCSYILNVLGDVNDNGLTTYDVGNMGGKVKTLEAGSSPEAIADAVWNEDVTTHTTLGTFGYFMQSKLLTVSKFLGLK